MVGMTQDGGLVVAGVYRFVETHGVPLDVTLERLREHGMTPDWWDVYREAEAAGMKRARILAKVGVAALDVYGRATRNAIMAGLLALTGCGGFVAAPVDSGALDGPGDTQTAVQDTGQPDAGQTILDALDAPEASTCAHPICCVDNAYYRCANAVGSSIHACATEPDVVCHGSVCFGTRCP